MSDPKPSLVERLGDVLAPRFSRADRSYGFHADAAKDALRELAAYLRELHDEPTELAEQLAEAIMREALDSRTGSFARRTLHRLADYLEKEAGNG